MKNVKTLLTIVSLLVIGFTAGFFTNRQLVKQHIQKVGEMGGGPRLQDHIFDAISATEEQKDILNPIIKEHGVELRSLMKETRSNRRQIMDQMFEEIRAEITPEQQQKLTDFRKRYVKRRRPEKGPNGEFKRKRERRPKEKAPTNESTEQE